MKEERVMGITEHEVKTMPAIRKKGFKNKIKMFLNYSLHNVLM